MIQMQHRLHVAGFDKPVKITNEQAMKIRNILTGADVTSTFVVIGNGERTLLVAVQSIVALEASLAGRPQTAMGAPNMLSGVPRRNCTP